MIYIYFEDLVAFAFIKALQKGKRFLTYSQIEKYGNCIIKNLEKNNQKAFLMLSRKDTEILLQKYENFFTEAEKNGNLGIELRQNKNIDDLINKFTGYLSLAVLKAFMEENIT